MIWETIKKEGVRAVVYLITVLLIFLITNNITSKASQTDDAVKKNYNELQAKYTAQETSIKEVSSQVFELRLFVAKQTEINIGVNRTLDNVQKIIDRMNYEDKDLRGGKKVH